MCKVLDDYGKWENKHLLFDMVSTGDTTIEAASKRLHMTEAEILDEMEKEGYKVQKIW